MATMNNKSTGMFIPIELIKNNELDWGNKALLTEIISLSKLPAGCHISNQKLADLVGINRSAIIRRINFLVDNGYITTKNEYLNNKCVGRMIYPTGKVVADLTRVVATATNSSRKGDHSVVATATVSSRNCDPIKSVTNSLNNTLTNTVLIQEFSTEEELDKILNKLNDNYETTRMAKGKRQ